MAYKVFRTRESAVAHAHKLGWITIENSAGWVHDALNKRGQAMKLRFEWKNSTRYTSAEGAGDNYWWGRA